MKPGFHYCIPQRQSTATSSIARISEDIVSETVPHNGSTLRVATWMWRQIVTVKKSCCVCFEFWHDNVLDENGTEWIFCKCSKWLHENCVEEAVEDEEDIQQCCSFCVDKYTIQTLVHYSAVKHHYLYCS